MRRLILFLMITVLLGINGVFLWKSRGGVTTRTCQLTSAKIFKVNGTFVLPGSLVVLM